MITRYIEKAGGNMCFEAIRMREVARYIGKEEVLIIDLREREDYMRGHVPGARNFPYDETEDIQEWCADIKQMVRLYEDRKKINVKKIFIYCERGNISLYLIRDMNKIFGNIYNLYGGYLAYRGPVEKICAV